MSRPWHLRKTPKVYYCVDFPQDDLPDGPFDVVTGRGLQPVLPFPGDGPEQNYRVDLAAPVVTVPFQTRELSLRQRPAQLGSEASAPNDLDRFVQAQSNNCYETALEEMRAGAKRSHWMWYIFPQLAGVAARPSLTSARYAVRDLAEAVEFLRHPVLGRRLREMVAVVAGSEAGTAVALMGSQVDVLKLQSCMTLFRRAERVLYGRGYALTREDEYWAVLKKYYNEEECKKTVQILG